MTCVSLLLHLSPCVQKERRKEEQSLFCTHLYPAVVRLLAQPQQIALPQRERSTWITVARLKNTPFKDHLRVTLCGEQALSDAQRLFSSLAEQPFLSSECGSYRVLSVDLARAPWATVSTWTDLLVPTPQFPLRLHFVTPMFTGSENEAEMQEDFFPQPLLVFGTLFDLWRHLHGPTLSQHLMLWLQDRRCVVSAYKLQAVPIAVRNAAGSSKTRVGWTGWITYTCLERYSSHMTSLWALARFATFVGSGTATERGFGVTQIMEKREERR